MKKVFLILTVLLIIVLSLTSCAKKMTPADELVEYGPFSNARESVSITFYDDGTYSFKMAGDFYDHTDYEHQQAIYTHYEGETINQPFQEVFKYEYKYKYHGKTFDWVIHSDDAWIAIYRLENCNSFWKEKYGGEMYVALDGNTKEYGKITIFQYSTTPTTDYLDTLRPNINGIGGSNDSGYIPLEDVGCKVEYVQKTHKNVDGNNITLVNAENKEK